MKHKGAAHIPYIKISDTTTARKERRRRKRIRMRINSDERGRRGRGGENNEQRMQFFSCYRLLLTVISFPIVASATHRKYLPSIVSRPLPLCNHRCRAKETYNTSLSFNTVIEYWIILMNMNDTRKMTDDEHTGQEAQRS
ncbi:hypothetical protein BDZ89DRAFT_411186 [Hymenopellis radicata]|nr:hypothetical protein BDZ89DRAFT_411186 [Hymenopellis radicata]